MRKVGRRTDGTMSPREIRLDGCMKCSKCEEWKPKEKFSTSSSKCGRHSWCRSCCNKDKEKQTVVLKNEVITAYGGFCVCCGESKREFLCIDHINGDGSEERRKLFGSNAVGSRIYRFLRRQGFPKDRYRLLCMNCNFSLGHYGYCPHERTLVENTSCHTTACQ